MELSQKFRVPAAYLYVMTLSLAVVLRHLRVINNDWALGMIVFAVIYYLGTVAHHIYPSKGE
jgi:hypothetical protein